MKPGPGSGVPISGGRIFRLPETRWGTGVDKVLHDATSEYLRTDLPQFAPGDRIAVDVRVVEGNRTRVQTFECDVIAMSGAGINRTFTVRKISDGIGVERIFPIHSPSIAKIKVVRRGKVRRAKLYFLRDRIGKATRLKERRPDWKKKK